MIRLIASDLDGTLLQNGAQSLTEEALELIEKAKELGIQFVAASGRQYANMKRLFAPVWQDIIFIAENGALMVRRDEILDKTVISPTLARELIQELYRCEYCDVVVSGVHSSYMQPKPRSGKYVDFILYKLRNTLTIVDDLCGLNEEIIKISAIVYDDKVHQLGKQMIPKWSGRFHAAVAGREWLDFTLTNKGEAIEKLRTQLGLEREELVAFGDNYNDESMFRSVPYSYAMSGAKDEVQRMARHSCGSVEGVLKNLIDYFSD